MIPFIAQLIVGFLGLGALALIVLIWALKHTANGVQDAKGFHFDTTSES